VGYLAHTLAAVGALFAYEQGLRTSFESWWVALALCLAPYALLVVERALLVRGAFRAAAVVHPLLVWSGPLAFATAVCVGGWPASVERWLGAEHSLNSWPGAALLASLAPFVIYTALGIDALARLNEVRGAQIAKARAFQLRMFSATLAPFVLFLVLTWMIGANARWRANVEHTALWSSAFTLSLATIAVLTLPELLRRTWDTVPLPPGRVRSELEQFARNVRFRCREFLVWRTGHQMSNAAVVGVAPSTRVVVFSDLLLAQLPLRELLAVLAHEMGHVACGHVITFIAWSSALFLGLDLALVHFDVHDEIALGVALAAALALWWAGFGWLSRRAELEADLFALHATGDVLAMVSALELVGGYHARAKSSWRHFSTARRVRFLLDVAEDESVARSLKRRMKLASRVGRALCVLALVAEGARLAESYADDRVRVELALGEYQRAAEFSAAETVDERTRRLAQLALEWPEEQRTAEMFESEAERALERENLQRAVDLLTLLVLRGDARAEALLGALEEQLRTGSR
jgi:Zn-dependent protease with chaperone function